MNEFIEVRFRKPAGARLRVRRQTPNGIEFDEHDPIERTVGFTFKGRSEATRYRMRHIAQVKGWDVGQFKLAVSVEDGSLILRGVDADALPEGAYSLRVRVEELTTKQDTASVDVTQDGHDTLDVEAIDDDREVDVDLTNADAQIGRVLDASRLDGKPAGAWLDDDHRPARKACLLNLLASLRVRPTVSDRLIDQVLNVYQAFNDRVYMKVDRAMLPRVEELAQHPAKPFYREGEPHAAIHGRLKETMPEPPEVKAQFGAPISFRGEQSGGGPSLQMVILPPPPALAHTYAEFDLDLGNPLQDLAGFIVHIGELLDGKSTNHLDLRKKLAKTSAKPFLYYTVTAG